ncbi:MAG: glycoside hydrolase family 108 protein [bacterium]
MQENFKKIMTEVLEHEGGYVNDPHDRGGATNRGVTRCTLAAYRGVSCANLPIQEVKDLTLEETMAIYRKNYWDRCLADDLPSGVDYAVMDYAVNSGVSRSAKLLQRIVGAKADGVIGLKTLGRVHDYADYEKLIHIACDNRLSFLQGLKDFRRFGRGWTRRVKSVREGSIALVQASQLSETVKVDGDVLVDVQDHRTIKEIAIALGIWVW